MSINALEFCLKNGMTHSVLLSSVVNFEIEVLDELLEGVLVQVTQEGLGLGYSGNKSCKESLFHN